MSDAESLKKCFEGMQKAFKPNSIDKDQTVYFSLGDGPGMKWTMWIGPTKCEIKEGKLVENADNFLKTSADLFVQMIQGKYKPGAMDFMRGKISAKDPFKLQGLFKAFGV
jgi:putative sterol carrier protein